MKVPILLPNIFNYPFTYNSSVNLKVGEFVEVPFGKTKIVGVVWDTFEETNNKNYKLKNVIKKFDIPGLKKETVKFLDWFSQYNLIPKGMALKLMLLSSQVVEKLPDKDYLTYTCIKKKSIFNTLITEIWLLDLIKTLLMFFKKLNLMVFLATFYQIGLMRLMKVWRKNTLF